MKAKLQKKTIDGHDIAYREFGNGEPVFCIPPWPSSSLVYRPLAKLIPEVKFIAFDQPGWGGNTEPIKKDYKYEEYVALNEKFIQSFGFDDYNILGYSYGGMIAQTILEREKIKMQKLILISTMRHGKVALWPNWVGLLIQLMNLCSKFPLISRLISQNIETLYYFIEKRTGKYISEDYITQDFKNLIEDIKKCNSRTILSALIQLKSHVFLTTRFNKVPTLLIGGRKEPGLYRQEMNDLAKITGGKLHFINDATHNHLFFEPEKSATIISKFLQE